MSLHISFDDFQKMVEKECQKQTGLTLSDVPSVFCDDYWPVDFDEKLSVHEAKEAVETCIEAIINTISP
jgi:hypothetical protein